MAFDNKARSPTAVENFPFRSTHASRRRSAEERRYARWPLSDTDNEVLPLRSSYPDVIDQRDKFRPRLTTGKIETLRKNNAVSDKQKLAGGIHRLGVVAEQAAGL